MQNVVHNAEKLAQIGRAFNVAVQSNLDDVVIGAQRVPLHFEPA